METRITVTGGTLDKQEIQNYVTHLREEHPGRNFETIDIKVDGEYVDLSYKLAPVGFERIRRITGYLVGTVDRFNDAKRAEVEDRVKHKIAR
ncbi:MAG: hypothetical protein HFE45_09185 [Oscillospiraceae bacterium]|jgi:hypothetical protein|nr:hypothetical protein [Oscillospiraceae bacterium]